MTKFKLHTISLVLFAAAFFSTGILSAQKKKSSSKKENSSEEILMSCPKLGAEFRKQWEEQLTWTRNVIFCVIDGLPGTELAEEKLNENTNQLSGNLMNFYTSDTAKLIGEIFNSNTKQLISLFRALKVNDNGTVDASTKKLFENAITLADLFEHINPAWKKEDTKKLFSSLASLYTEMALARKSKSYEKDARTFDKTHDHILKISDFLAEGILNQFPEEFTPQPATKNKPKKKPP
jgi:hypothetical protein